MPDVDSCVQLQGAWGLVFMAQLAIEVVPGLGFMMWFKIRGAWGLGSRRMHERRGQKR